MAYTVVPSVVTGQAYSASNYNTYVRDNLAALWVFTAAGDIMYAASATTAQRLALGQALQRLRVNAARTGLEYAGDIYRRQGGHATNWNITGSTDFTPVKSILQTGVIRVLTSNGGALSYGDVTVTFPVPFSAIPLVLLTIVSPLVSFSGIYAYAHLLSASSISQCFIEVVTSAPTANYDVSWLAIGAP